MYNVFDEGKVVDRTVARKRRTLQMQDIHVMVTQTLATLACEGFQRPVEAIFFLRRALFALRFLLEKLRNHAADEPSGPFEVPQSAM